MASSPNPFGPSAWAAVGYALFFWLSVTWMVVIAPDWMLNYFAPAQSIPMPVAHGIFALCLVLGALSGHTLTAVQLQRGKTAGAVAVMVAGLVAWGGLWGLTLDRYMAYGDFAAWMAGTTVPIPESPVAGPMNIVGIASGLGLVIPAVLLWRSSSRLRAT